MRHEHLVKGLVVAQASVIIGLWYFLLLDAKANPFMELWLSQNFPLGLLLVNASFFWSVTGLLSFVAILLLASMREKTGFAGKVLNSLKYIAGASPDKEGTRSSESVYNGVSRESAALLLFGSAFLVASILTRQNIVAFVGLGLMFLGILPVYLKYESRLRPSSGFSPYYSESLQNAVPKESRIVYAVIPRVDGPSVDAYVVETGEALDIRSGSQGWLTILTGTSRVRRVRAPGLQILAQIEKSLGTDISDVKPSYLMNHLPSVLTDELKLATKASLTKKGDRFQAEIENSPMTKACETVMKLAPPHDSLGCELCSAIALAIAKSADKPAIIEDTVVSLHPPLIQTTYRVLGTVDDTL